MVWFQIASENPIFIKRIPGLLVADEWQDGEESNNVDFSASS